MSSFAPALVPISKFSQELGTLLTASLVELRKGPEDRVKGALWEKEIMAKIVGKPKLFGTNQAQHHQLNFLEHITQTSLISVEDAVDLNADKDDINMEEGHQNSSVTNSPPRKRSRKAPERISQQETSVSADIPVLSVKFQEFNQMPILSKNQIDWNNILQANPDFWILKCQSWKSLLDSAYQFREAFKGNEKSKVWYLFTGFLEEGC
ncbi:hypothetical protein GALMADRAFT_217425 [Galerina marginata CBS 339.88]|uniref:Uncharacterized protein n=1 Tax=Galerina marginata (strain CBS 339.88) TaxID=685588 RepID=A0A067S4H1_GALM3|nr:hypothetical protein GALMADRAFT_217425 [Galerina marginata CBS 339.88]